MHGNKNITNPSSLGQGGTIQVFNLRDGSDWAVPQADPAGATSGGLAGVGSGGVAGNAGPRYSGDGAMMVNKLTHIEIDFQATNERALEHIHPILEHWLPDGKYVGKEYQALNPKRNDFEIGSFSINIEKGVWCDFAAGEDARGGDLVSLIAYLEGCSQSEAAKKLLDFMASLDDPAKTEPRAQAKGKKVKIPAWTPIVPVPADAPPPFERHPTHGIPSKIWPYKTAESAVAAYVFRFDPPGGRKEILPLTYCQDAAGDKQWRWKGLPEPRPLYKLDQLTARPDAPVLVCEGEKAADAAALLFPDHVCVTSSNGAKSASKTDWSPLKGRDLFIWPDHDKAGRAYAEAVIQLLRSLDAKARVSIMKPIVRSPGKNNLGEPILVDGFATPDGWDAADAVEAGWTADHFRLLGQEWFVPVSADNAYCVGDFRVSDAGVFFQQKDKNGQPYEIRVCSRIDIVALSRDAQNQNWGLVLEFKDSDGKLHRWCMPMEMLAIGSACRGPLLNMGLNIAPSERYDYISAYLLAAKPSARALSVSKPGWHNGVFVLPNRIIGRSQEIVALQTNDPTGANIFKQQGTEPEWQQQVAAPCQGNSRLVLAICAALTGPVLDLLQEESGGFHLQGPSSTGKTTSLEVGASVWGGRDFVRTWRTTDNALEAVATRHNDTLLALDEMSQVDPRKVGEVVYMLANGQGKGRANQSGGGRPVASWRLMILSTGEVTTADHLASGNMRSMAGQEVRMINIQADAGAGYGLFENIHDLESAQMLSIALKKRTTQHFGHAGPAFIEFLADDASRDSIVEQIRNGTESFIKNHQPVDSSGQVVRVLKRFALVAAVGEAAIKLNILPWAEGEAIQGARTCFYSWINARGGVANLEADQAIAQIQRFLEQHGESKFTSWDTNMGVQDFDRPTINRAGFRKKSLHGQNVLTERTEYFVFPESFRTEVCAGLNSRDVVNVLMQHGLLVTGSDGKAQKSVRLPGIGTKRMYHLSADIMGTIQEEEVESEPQPQQDPAVTQYSL